MKVTHAAVAVTAGLRRAAGSGTSVSVGYLEERYNILGRRKVYIERPCGAAEIVEEPR